MSAAFAKKVVSTVSRVRHPRNGYDICSESCLCGNNALKLLVFARVVKCTCVGSVLHVCYEMVSFFDHHHADIGAASLFREKIEYFANKRRSNVLR